MDRETERMVALHGGLVKSVAIRLSYIYGEELEDIIQIGYIGLLKAIKRFEPERGLKFSTYAVPMITGEIRTQLRDSGAVKVSRSLKSDIYAVFKAQNKIIMKTGVSPKIGQLAEETGMNLERVSQALAAADAMKNIEEYEKTDLWTEWEEHNIKRIDLERAMKLLTAEQKQVIVMRYYKDYTQQQVADVLGISQVQVCRIEKGALRSMKTGI